MMSQSAPARRLYDDALYRFGEPQPSYWEASAGDRGLAAAPLDGDESADVAIIGGGYTGLSAALALARDHAIDARVLEAGHIGWGASGRNGGFCAMGGTAAATSSLLRRYGAAELKRYYRAQADAVELVRAIIADEDIDAAVAGDAELELAHTPRAREHLESYCAWQRQTLGIDAEYLSADAFRAAYFDSAELFGAARVRPAFGLHPLRYHLGLARAAVRHGARLHPSSEVLAWSKEGGRHLLRTASGSVRARFVVVGANGFMPEHLHAALHGRALPVISAIVVTRPLTDDELARYAWRTACPAINARRVLNYFRLLPEKRLLFGGRGSARGTPRDQARQSRQLVRQLRRAWPAWRDVGVDYAWHGLICMTRRLTPALARLPEDPSVFVAFGYHGNGVNTATWSGRMLADWLAADGRDGGGFERRLPAPVRALPPRFPLPSARLLYLRAAIAAFRLRDRVG